MAPTIPTPIPRRALGSQGLMVPMQGLGCMGMTAFYTSAGENNEAESLATIARALELGMNFFDTAWAYQDFASGVTNEGLLGKAIKAHGRDKFVIATKFGIAVTPQGPATDSSEETMTKQLEESLARLGTDYIDLYYQHRHDPKVPVETVMATLKKFVDAGKIKYVGLSECTPDELRRAHKVHPVSAIQMEWSLQTRDVEHTVAPVARELGVGIVAYSPLGRGLLSGGVQKLSDLADNDWRRTVPRFSPENFAANASSGEKLDQFAQSKGCTAAQVALAYLQGKGQDIFPIPGTKRVVRLEENLGSCGVTLTADEITMLEKMIPEGTGDRYTGMGGSFNQRL